MKEAADPRTTMTTTQIRAKTAWAWVTATFFGIGFLPGGPGTWASLVTATVWYFAVRTVDLDGFAFVVLTLVAILAVILVGIPAASVVERESARQDPGQVVIDEVAGQLTALLYVPGDIWHVVLAFALFRFFDILKPPPIRKLERLRGGLGIMVDDVAAGLYALLIGLVVHHWW
jgi:phosphatidylglycerophosphatase A